MQTPPSPVHAGKSHPAVPCCSAKCLHKCGLPLLCDLHWALIFSGPRTQACPLGLPNTYVIYTQMFSRHTEWQTAEGIKYKIHIFIHCYSPDFLRSQLQGHLNVLTVPTSLPLLTHCSKWAVTYIILISVDNFVMRRIMSVYFSWGRISRKSMKGSPPSIYFYFPNT